MINNNRSESVAPAKGSEKVSDIRKELEELGSIKESLLSQISEGKKLASELSGLEKEVEEKKDELNSVSKTIDKLNNIVVALRSENDKLEKQKEEYHKILDDIATIKNIRDNHQASLDRDSKELNEKIDVLTQTIYKKEQSLIKLSEDERLAINKLEDVNTKCQAELDILNDLKDQNSLERQHAKVLENDIDGAKNTLNKLKEDANYIIISANKQAEKIVLDANDNAENIISKSLKEKEERELELIKREGEVSDKESLLKIREDLLRDIKVQLEEKLGKRITNINL